MTRTLRGIAILIFLNGIAAPMNAQESATSANRSINEGNDSDLQNSFNTMVQPLLAKYCLRCHNAETMKSGIRVDQLDTTLTDSHLYLWRDIRNQLNDAAMPPGDELQPTTAERDAVSRWIEGAMNAARSRNTQKNGSVRRLTVSQYRNTMRTLLGLRENLSDVLPPDGISRDGFANNGQVLGLSPLQLEYYFDIAEKSLDLCIVEEDMRPVIQSFRMDLGKNINPEPCTDKLILGANSLLLENSDFVVQELAPEKSFGYTPFAMQTAFRFIEGYVGNDTIRKWRSFDSIYHSVFACVRGTEGYPLGEPFQSITGGLLLRPAIPSPEIFGESNTYGPMANFKVSLRELPDHGDFRITIRASRYDDGLLLDTAESQTAVPESSDTLAVMLDAVHTGEATIGVPGVYQVDVLCVMSEPTHLLRLKIGARDFSRTIASKFPADATAEISSQEQQHAFVVFRLAAGPLAVSSSSTDKTMVKEIRLTRLPDSSPDMFRFLAFEKRSPLLGVHLGLRRDCGSTLNRVESPKIVSNSEPQAFTFVGAINDFPYPAVEKDNVNYLAGIREIGVRSKYTDGRPMPRLKIDSVEFEGPLYDSWPPETHRRIFIDSPNRDDKPAYATEILRSFMTRAWRRPVSDVELASIMKVWDSSFAASADFQQSIKDALLVVLTSPQFLFLIENSAGPDAEDLDGWELASKLSYFLWNEPPDATLLSAAEGGELRSSLNEHCDRLMRDSQFDQFVQEFASQWLSLDKFDVVEVDRAKFPLLTRDTRTHLRQEPVQFLKYAIANNLPLASLVQSDFVVVNDTTAYFYGFADRSENGFQFAAMRHEDPALGGLLSQAAILSGLSDGRESNPVKRGAWLARKILAEPPEDPPPNVPQLKEDGEERSLRERLERHRNQDGCVKCHMGIDPWGIAFEEYDAGGRLKHDPADAKSELPDGTTVSGLRGLRDYLATDRIDQVAFSFLKHLSSYAVGRSLTYNELEWLKQAGTELKSNDYRLQDMIHFVVNSDVFLKK
jgi:hypothetical protein